MTWVSAVLALIKSLPWFQKKFDELVMAYTVWKIEQHEKEFAEALAAIIRGDQTKLEQAIGSDNAGKPARRRDGVRERRKKTNDPTGIGGDPTSSN